MNNSTYYKTVLTIAMSIFASAQLTEVHAGCGLHTTHAKCGSCSETCPKCDHVCVLTAEKIEVEKSCFEVEKKVICIPRVVFPWQKKESCGSCDGRGCSNCVHNGARIFEVKVLKTKKYKCPECAYTWTPEKRPCGSCGGCDAGCDNGCDANYMSAQSKAAPQNHPPAPLATPNAFETVHPDSYHSGLQTVDVEGLAIAEDRSTVSN